MVEGVDWIEVELENASASPIGAGGLLMRVQMSWEGPSRMSVSNHWSLAPGDPVLLCVLLPRPSIKAVEFVAYVERDGTVHELGSKLAFGIFSSRLVDARADGPREGGGPGWSGRGAPGTS